MNDPAHDIIERTPEAQREYEASLANFDAIGRNAVHEKIIASGQIGGPFIVDPNSVSVDVGAPTPVSARRALLEESAELIDGDRNAQYGEPNQDFDRTSEFWGVYLAGVAERKLHEDGETGFMTVEDVISFIRHLIDSWDVGHMQDLLKTSRSTVSPFKRDHYADKAGYTACAWHCVVAEGRADSQ